MKKKYEIQTMSKIVFCYVKQREYLETSNGDQMKTYKLDA